MYWNAIIVYFLPLFETFIILGSFHYLNSVLNEMITGQQNLCEIARRYFLDLFTPKGGFLEPVLSLISPRVLPEDNAKLEAPITKEEV
jgi:hypothetical protein